MYHAFWGLASMLIGLGLAVPTYVHWKEHLKTPFSDQPLIGIGGMLFVYGLATAIYRIWHRRDATARKARGPWYQFRLATLLKATAYCAMLMAVFVIYIKPYRDRNAAWERLKNVTDERISHTGLVEIPSGFAQFVYGGPKREPLDGISLKLPLSADDYRDLEMLISPDGAVNIEWIGNAILAGPSRAKNGAGIFTSDVLPTARELQALAPFHVNELRLVFPRLHGPGLLDVSGMGRFSRLDFIIAECDSEFVLKLTPKCPTRSINISGSLVPIALRFEGEAYAADVDLSRVTIRDVDLKGVRFAEKLHLDHATIMNDASDESILFERLEELHITACQIEGTSLRKFKMMKRGVTGRLSVYLNDTQITDDDLEYIAAWRNLFSLDLRRTPIEGRGLYFLRDLGQMAVDLRHTKLTRENLQYLLYLHDGSVVQVDRVLVDDARTLCRERGRNLEIESSGGG